MPSSQDKPLEFNHAPERACVASMLDRIDANRDGLKHDIKPLERYFASV